MTVLTSPVHALTTTNLQVAVCMIMPEFYRPPVKSSIWVSHLQGSPHRSMHGTSAVSIILVMFMAEMGFHLVHIPFLDAAAKYSVLFGDSLPPTLISQRARSMAVSTNSCVIGIQPRIGSIERWESIGQKALLWRGLEVFMNVYIRSWAAILKRDRRNMRWINASHSLHP